MRISPCRVHNQATRIFTNGLGEAFGTLFEQDRTPTLGAGLGGIERRTMLRVGARLEVWDDNFGFEAWFALRRNF